MRPKAKLSHHQLYRTGRLPVDSWEVGFDPGIGACFRLAQFFGGRNIAINDMLLNIDPLVIKLRRSFNGQLVL